MFRSLATVAGAVGLAMCVDTSTGPGTRAPIRAEFAFAPEYAPSAHRALAVLADIGLPLDRVRVTIKRPGTNAMLADTTVTIHSGDPELVLDLSVTAIPDEALDAALQFKSGETVLFEGKATVTARAAVTPIGTVTPAVIPIVFVGPGAKATRVVVTPTSGVFSTVSAVAFSAQAFDSAGAAIPNTTFVWTVNDGTLGAIDLRTGVVTPTGKRGALTASASTLGDVIGAATVNLLPPAAKIVVVSGDNQTAFVTTQASQPLIVSVLGADNLGLANQTVTLAATDGGTIAPATLVTDANGAAQATIKFGNRMGTYNFTATSGTFVVGAKGTGTLGPAAQLTAVGPTSFTITSGIAPTAASKVLVSDAGGNPVPGVPVSVDIAMGTTSQQLALTSDANGFASLPASVALTATAGVFTAKISSASIAGALVTFTVTVLPGAASAMVITAGNSQTAAVGAAVSVKPAVKVTDVNGNAVPGVPVTFAVVGGGGSVTVATPTTGTDGIATVGSWTLGPKTGANAVTATAAGLTGSPLTFSATATVGAASAVAINAGDNQSAIAGSAVVTKPSVKVVDANGNAVPGATVTFAVASGAGAITVGTTTTGTDGVATVGSWTLGTTAGVNTLTATATGLTGSPLTFSASATAGAASVISINAGSNQTAVAATATSLKPSIKVADANGNPVSGVTVTFAVASGGGSITAATPITGTDGVATIGGWTLGATAGSNTLTATATGLTGSPLTFTATGAVGPATAIAIAAGNGQIAIAGTAVSIKPAAKVTDANGNAVSGVTVSFALASGGGSITGGSATTGADGVATVGNWTLGAAAGTNTIAASVTGLAGSPVTFTATAAPGGLHHFLITSTTGAPISSQVAGTAFTVRIVAQDANNNTVTNYTGAPTLTSSAALAAGGGSTGAFTGGVLTARSLTVSNTGNFTVTATDGAVTSASNSFSVGTSAATNLVLSTTAAGATSGVAFTTQPAVAVRDATGNTLTGDNSTVVTVLVSTGATVIGTSTATAAAGVATFAGVGISGTAGTNYTLTFTAGALTPVTQGITATVGAATQLVLTTNAAGAASGAAFSTQPVVAVRDASGNVRTTDNTTVVTMTVSAGATVIGTATTTVTGGVGTFAGVGISGTAGTSYTLSFGAGALTSATQSITPSVGAATQLVLTTPAAGAASGAAFGTQPVVTVRDASGSVQTTDNTTLVTMTVSAGATVVGTSTATAAAGVATFAGVGISGTAGTTYTLTFGAGGLTSASQGITPTVGAATQLVLTTPAAGASSGAAFGTQPVVAVRDAAGNPRTSDNATVVTMTVSAGATIVNTATATAASGVVTFTNVGINGTTGTTYTLTFGATGLSSAIQTITPSAGTIAWTNTSGGLWSNPANWNLGRVPLTGDSVVITAGGTYTVSLDTTFTATYITVGAGSGTQTLSLSGRTLTVSGVMTIRSSGAFNLANSAVVGGGAFVNQGAVTIVASAINTSLTNQGTLTSSGSSSIGGAIITTSGSIVRVGQVDGSTSQALLTVANGFTNNGAIELTVAFAASYDAQLSVTTGTLTNAVGATISALGGAAPGGSRVLGARLNNQGTITAAIGAPLIIDRVSAAHTNSGTIDASAASITLQQTGTTPSFTNTGTITIGSGKAFAVSGGTLNHNTGTFGGAGTLSLTSGVATFVAPVTPASLALTSAGVTISNAMSTASTAISLQNSSISGTGTLTNAAGQTLLLAMSSLYSPVINQGILVASGPSSINGSLTTAVGSTLRVGQVDGTTSVANLTVANGFTNNGAIELTVIFAASYNAQLTVTSGTLTNASGATIAALGGTVPGGARILAAQLNNQGTVTLGQPLTLDRAGGAHVNSGTIDVSGGNLILGQTGATPSFTNSGTISIGSGFTVAVTAGAFNYSGGSITGPGTLVLSGATLNVSGNLSTANLPVSISNSTINGTGTFTNATGNTLTLVTSTINAPFVNQGTLIASGSTSLNGALSTSAGSTLRVAQVDGFTGLADLTVANGFTNNGAIELTVIFPASYSARLTVTSGPLINASGATITSLGGTVPGGSRILTAEVDNQGTITAASGAPLTIDHASAAHDNSGTIDASAASISIVQSGVSDFLSNTGTITIGAGRTFGIQNGGFNHTGGTIGGAGTLSLTGVTANLAIVPNVNGLTMTSTTATVTSALSIPVLVLTNSALNGVGSVTNGPGHSLTLVASTINVPLSNQGTLIASGASTINGVLTTSVGSTLRIGQVDGSVGTANLTVANGFTNNGAIELTVIFAASYGSQLTVNDTLTNASGATISALGGTVPGGARTISATVVNQGTIDVYPGAAGVFTINGGLTTSGIINLEIGGTTAGTQYDQLVVTGGNVTLGGTLNVALINLFTPSSSQSFTALGTSGLVFGTFASVNLPGTMTLQYNANSLVVNVP